MSRSLLSASRALILLTLLMAMPCRAEDPTARMDEIVRSYVDAKQFMGSVLVARGEEVIFSRGYGSANLEWDIPNTPTTKFRLASLSKQFTAACVLLLEERGKLSVQDPISKYLPDAPAAWKEVRIFHLLTHSSGIPDYTDFPDFKKWRAIPTTAEELIQRFIDEPLEFAPGEKMEYSNSGYVVLGALIEKLSGKTYEQFVQENIFTPLGMKDSGYDSQAEIIPRRASGYSPGRKGIVNASFIHMSVPYAAGGLYSTTEDLLRWEQALFGGKLLSAASLRKMTTPFKNDYAFGLVAGRNHGRRTLEHRGGIAGFNTMLAYYPDDQVTVVALGNLNGWGPVHIVEKLGAVVHGETVKLLSERKEITVAPEILKTYVGTYSAAPDVTMTITLDDGQLMSQIAGQDPVPLFAESETIFFPKVVDAEVEFLRSDNGAVTALVLRQSGREQKWQRTGS